MRVMGLDASGSATVSGGTEKKSGEHVTSCEDRLRRLPVCRSRGWVGGHLRDRASNSTPSGTGSPSAATFPRHTSSWSCHAAEIHDISTFNALIPEQTALDLESGTGTVESKLEINERVAIGTLDLVAKEISLETKDTPLVMGDLEVHAKLAEGDLAGQSTSILSGTTIRLDKIVDKELSDKKQEKLDAWFCDVELEQGEVTFGKPMAADGRVKIEMHDTRPVMAFSNSSVSGPSGCPWRPTSRMSTAPWMSMFGKGYLAFDDLDHDGGRFRGPGMDARPRQEDRRPALRQVQGGDGRGLHRSGQDQDPPLQTAEVVRGAAHRPRALIWLSGVPTAIGQPLLRLPIWSGRG